VIKIFPEAFRINTVLEHLRTPLIRNGYALIISTGITSLLGLLYWTIAARVYATENVGLNSTVISAMLFLSGIAQLNLQETMIRFIPQAGRQTLRLVLSTYGVVILLSIVVGLIFCLGISFWSPALSFLAESPASIAWFVFALVAQGLFVIQDSVLMGLREAIWIPFENAISSVFKILLLIGFVAIFPLNGIFISWTLSVALMILPVSYLIFRILIPASIRKAKTPIQSRTFSLRQLTKYVAGNYVVAILANMSTALMPMLITQLVGATANAHFYIAWVLASSLQIAVANMATSLTVEGAANQENLEEHRRRAMTGIARIVIPMAVIIIFGAPLILQVMGPGYSENSTMLMQLLAISALPNIYNMVFVALARVQNRIYSVVGVYAANAVMVLGLSALLLPHFGITGVGFAWVISQTSIAIVLSMLPKFKRTAQVAVAVTVTPIEKES
jgi:O-antigen/teichoic acid export membrane protein